jgi:hypothetical protein
LFEDTPEEYEMRIGCVQAAKEMNLPVDYNGHPNIVDTIPMEASKSGLFCMMNPTQVGDVLLAIDRHLARRVNLREPNPEEDAVIHRISLNSYSTLVLREPQDPEECEFFWNNVLHDLNRIAEHPGVHAPELFSQVASQIETLLE